MSYIGSFDTAEVAALEYAKVRAVPDQMKSAASALRDLHRAVRSTTQSIAACRQCREAS